MSEGKTSQKSNANNLNQFNKYLDNNIDVLHQKFLEYYGDPFPFQEVTSPDDLQFSIKYIYDIFNFGKYEANPALNKTLKSSLVVNIKTFVQDHTKEYQTFDKDVAVKLLKYCIQNNEMFAVHYDKRKPPKKPIQEKVQQTKLPEPIKNQIKEVLLMHQPKQVQVVKQEAEQKIEVMNQQTKNDQIFNSTPTQQPTKIEVKERKNLMIEETSLEKSNVRNQFLSQQQAERVENAQLIKKQLKSVFQFYCKQQQNVSPHSTFDNINHKCQTMNLGKFIAFAIASNLIISKQKADLVGKLDKRIVVAAYKKIAEGQKQIDFTRFLNVMQELKKIDIEIYSKLGVGTQGAKGKIKLLEKLKYFNLPFNTRDPQGRQKMPINKAFIPKLTTHSGKHQADLKDQLLSRKQRAKWQPQENSRIFAANKMVPLSPAEENTKFNSKLGLSRENIESHDLNFLSKLIKQEDNDELFLKEYQLPQKKAMNLDNLGKINNKSLDKGRYNQERSGVTYTNLGALTSRKTKKQEFTLPSIRKRGIQTQLENNRASIGIGKKNGDISLISSGQ